jgi:RNA polymerase sigma-54 factor
VFEIKYFFSAGVGRGAGGAAPKGAGRSGKDSAEGISSVSVKGFIKELVDSEDPKHPYSDQDMAEMLKAKGISISRRTVAKYRDEMQILSSSRRKRY